jgi:hypothetical protein
VLLCSLLPESACKQGGETLCLARQALSLNLLDDFLEREVREIKQSRHSVSVDGKKSLRTMEFQQRNAYVIYTSLDKTFRMPNETNAQEENPSSQ